MSPLHGHARVARLYRIRAWHPRDNKNVSILVWAYFASDVVLQFTLWNDLTSPKRYVLRTISPIDQKSAVALVKDNDAQAFWMEPE